MLGYDYSNQTKRQIILVGEWMESAIASGPEFVDSPACQISIALILLGNERFAMAQIDNPMHAKSTTKVMLEALTDKGEELTNIKAQLIGGDWGPSAIGGSSAIYTPISQVLQQRKITAKHDHWSYPFAMHCGLFSHTYDVTLDVRQKQVTVHRDKKTEHTFPMLMAVKQSHHTRYQRGLKRCDIDAQDSNNKQLLKMHKI